MSKQSRHSLGTVRIAWQSPSLSTIFFLCLCAAPAGEHRLEHALISSQFRGDRLGNAAGRLFVRTRCGAAVSGKQSDQRSDRRAAAHCRRRSTPRVLSNGYVHQVLSAVASVSDCWHRQPIWLTRLQHRVNASKQLASNDNDCTVLWHPLTQRGESLAQLRVVAHSDPG